MAKARRITTHARRRIEKVEDSLDIKAVILK